MAVGWLWAAWLTGWLVGANERERAAPCESSLYLDDKEPNLTQWNGRMVMETAFNLHRRSLFVDSLKVGVLLACLCPLSPALSGPPPSSRSISHPFARDEKGIVLYLSSSVRSYILFRLRVVRVREKKMANFSLSLSSSFFMIARLLCDHAKTNDSRRRRKSDSRRARAGHSN